MKVIIKGDPIHRDQIPINIRSKQYSHNTVPHLIIGPTCKECIFTVIDTHDWIICLRYRVNIAKKGDPKIEQRSLKAQKVNECKPGKYAYFKEG